MVERFDLDEGGFLGERGRMVPDEFGDYVRVADYEALERQLAEARAERVTLEERLATAYQAKYRCNEDANAERRLRLAAEAERDRLAADLEAAKVEVGEAMLIVETQDQQIKRLVADNARLREALRPLAKIAEIEDSIGTKDGESITINVNLCRAARAALAGKE